MTQAIDPVRLTTNLETSAAFLEACAGNDKINWRLPVIERQFTVAEVLRQAAVHIRTTG